MGSQLSALYYTLKSVIRDFINLSSRISVSPGIPVPNPSSSYWTVPNSPIARHGADAMLPSEVDVVVIGSGITGTATAKAILENSFDFTLRLAMLEARDACSGATGRCVKCYSVKSASQPAIQEWRTYFSKSLRRIFTSQSQPWFRRCFRNSSVSIGAHQGLARHSQEREFAISISGSLCH